MTKIEVLQICALCGVLVGLGFCLAVEAWLLWELRALRGETREIRKAAEQLQVDLFVEANGKGKGGEQMKTQLGKWVENARAVDVGVKDWTIGLLEGPPKATPKCTFDQLRRMDIVGLYELPEETEKG